MRKKISITNIVLLLLIIIIIVGTIKVIIANNNPEQKNNERKFKQALGIYKNELEEKTDLDENILVEGENIKKYIHSISAADINKYSIQNGKLIYIGKDENERKWSMNMGTYTSRLKAPKLDSSYKINSNSDYYALPISTNDSNNLYMNYRSIKYDNKDNSYIIKYDKKFNKVWKTGTTFNNIETSKGRKHGNSVYFLAMGNMDFSNKSRIIKINDLNGEIIWKSNTFDITENQYIEILNIDSTYITALVVSEVERDKLFLVNINTNNGSVENINSINVGNKFLNMLCNKSEMDENGNILLTYSNINNNNENKAILKVNSKGEKIFEIFLDKEEYMMFNNIIFINNSIYLMSFDKNVLKKELKRYDENTGQLIEILEYPDVLRDIIEIKKYKNYCILIKEDITKTNENIEILDQNFNKVWNIKINNESILDCFIDEKLNEMFVMTFRDSNDKSKGNYYHTYEFK